MGTPSSTHAASLQTGVPRPLQVLSVELRTVWLDNIVAWPYMCLHILPRNFSFFLFLCLRQYNTVSPAINENTRAATKTPVIMYI